MQVFLLRFEYMFTNAPIGVHGFENVLVHEIFVHTKGADLKFGEFVLQSGRFVNNLELIHKFFENCNNLLRIVPLFGFHIVILDSVLTNIMNGEGIIFEVGGLVGVQKEVDDFSQIASLSRVPDDKIIVFVLISDAIS